MRTRRCKVIFPEIIHILSNIFKLYANVKITYNNRFYPIVVRAIGYTGDALTVTGSTGRRMGIACGMVRIHPLPH